MFSLRIVSTSHYQAEPVPDLDVTYSTFRSADVKRVPVLRVFGATPAGQKTCMHVHGVFPYLYVPYDGSQPLDSYLRRFAVSLDKAINVANNSNANTQHVFKISLVSGIPMYGYHAEEQQFLKIYLYNPNSVRKAADLLLGGAVMNKSFQPHEAHIPYPLQLFIDYNLYGMNLINVAAVKFRRTKSEEGDGHDPKPSTSNKGGDDSASSSQEDRVRRGRTPLMHSLGSSFSSSTPTMQQWDLEDLPSDLLLPPSVECQSMCELEVDVVAADILNRKEVMDNIGGNPGLAALWEDERQRRRDGGLASQITPQESQEHENVESSDSEKRLMERLAEIIQEHRLIRRSESEESAVSMEDSMLSQSDVPCIPASQLEDHSTLDDSEMSQLSQRTVIVVGEEEGESHDFDQAPLINLESIQRVVSFSQSFSRSSSQPSVTPAGDNEEAADRSLVEVLAALAEESSPSSSQQSANHIAALEDRDSIVGQAVPLPPDEAALQEDEEETLEMSQIVQVEEEEEDRGPEDENLNFDLEGLDSTWNGSPDSDHVMKTDDEDDDDGDIPQLDGTSDEKPASADKSSKKRLGVRGPVVSGSPSELAAGSSTGDQGVPAPNSQQYGNFMSHGQQPPGGYPQNYPQQQWMGESSGGSMGRPPQAGYPHPTGGWPQSPGQYPGMYGGSGQGQQSGNGFGGFYSYPHPHRPPFSPAHSQGGMHGQFSPGHPNFSPPPHSPMSPLHSAPTSAASYGGSSSSGGGMQGFQQPSMYPQGMSGASPQHQFATPSTGSQPGAASVARRHSVGSVGHSPQHSPMGWSYPRPGFPGPAAKALSNRLGDSLSPPYTTGSQPGESPKQQSELQALLEAPPGSSGPASTSSAPPSSGCAPPQYRRTMSADSSSNLPIQGVSLVQMGQGDSGFKLPEKRSGSFSGPSGAGTAAGVGALSNLYNFVSNVDPSARTPTPTSTVTPSSTPNSAPSPSLQARDEEPKTFVDLSSGMPKTSPVPPSSHAMHSRSMSLEELTTSTSPVHGCPEDRGVKAQTSQERGDPVPSAAPVPRNERLGKQAKMKKLGLSLQRNRTMSSESGPFTQPAPCASYTYTFHVPTPVFKRLKLQGVFPPSKREEVKVVRMHPMDARRYSLLKIGRELVKVTRLSRRELSNIFNALNIRTPSLSCAQTGDDVSSPGGPSRIVGTNLRMVAGRLVGPKNKKWKSVRTEGGTQTVSLVAKPNTGVSGIGGLTSQSESRTAMQCGPTQPGSGPHSAGQGNIASSAQPPTGHPGMGSSSGQGFTNMPPSSPGQWSYVPGNQQPSVKTEYMSQSPSATVHHPQGWGMGSPHHNQPGPWGQGMGPGSQWSGPAPGQWPAGRYGDWQRSPQMASGVGGYGYPSGVKDEKSMHSPPAFQYPQGSWPGSSPASTTASPSPSSSQPNMSPSGQPGGPGFPYSQSHPYGHNYPSYGPTPYNQSAPYGGHSPMNPAMNKFMPGAYHSPGVPRHPHYPSGQSGGSFQPGQFSPQYPGPPGYVSPSGQQGQFSSNTAGFPSQHNGSFSPPVAPGVSPSSSQFNHMSPSPSQHSPMSPSTSVPQQSPATICHRPQFFPPSSQQGQFSPPVHSQGQFPMYPGQQQGQYPNQAPGGQFTQPVASSSGSGFTPHSDASNTMPPNSQSQSFLTQGACQDLSSRATDPSTTDRPSSHSGPNNSPKPWQAFTGHAEQQQTSAASGLNQHSSSPNSESNSSTDTNKPPLNVAELMALQVKRSKLKQTPEDFQVYKGGLRANKKSWKKDRYAAENSVRPVSEEKFLDAATGLLENHTKFHEQFYDDYGDQKVKRKSRESRAVSSEDDFSSSSSSSRKSKMSGRLDGGSHWMSAAQPGCMNRRRTTVELMSDFDSDEDDNDFDDESDDSCEDYQPGKKITGVKRKRCSRGESKRAKRASVNYGRNAFSHFLKEEGERRKVCRSGRKNSKDGKKKPQKLVEGVHYIVVGKFKGHRAMLVKVSKVKVTLNERVKVSEWADCSENSRSSMEGSASLPATYKKMRHRNDRHAAGCSSGKTNDSSNVDSIQTRTGLKSAEEAAGYVSDASTIVDEAENTVVEEAPSIPNRSLGKEREKDGESASEQLEKQNTEQENATAVSDRKVLNASEAKTENSGSEKCLNNGGSLEAGNPQTSQSGHPAESECSKDMRGESAKSMQRNEMECEEGKEVLGEECEKPVGTEVRKDGRTCVQENHVGQQPASHCLGMQDSPLCSDQKVGGEPEGEGRTREPADQFQSQTGEKDAAKAAAAAEESPRSDTPVSKQGKLLIDSPSVVYQFSCGEHSQDADCSSLPHSNPESNSSSPVFPRLSFSSSLHNNGKDSELFSQSKSDSKHHELEQSDSEKKCPDTFCFQISHNVKETSKPIEDLDDDSSDSTDSNACFSDRACGDSSTISQSVCVTRTEKLSRMKEESETKKEDLEMDKDKLRKQKTLTTNQRLGVAFLSKKRKKVKTRITQPKGGRSKKNTMSEKAPSKLMNSLSALHFATLASLEDQITTEDSAKDSVKFSENIVKVSENTLVISENSFVVHEDIIKVSENVKDRENDIRVFEDVVRIGNISKVSAKNTAAVQDLDRARTFEKDVQVAETEKSFRISELAREIPLTICDLAGKESPAISEFGREKPAMTTDVTVREIPLRINDLGMRDEPMKASEFNLKEKRLAISDLNSLTHESTSISASESQGTEAIERGDQLVEEDSGLGACVSPPRPDGERAFARETEDAESSTPVLKSTTRPSEDADQVSDDEEVVKENTTHQPVKPRTRKSYLKRRKTQKNKTSSKVMNSLSALHMATLASLEDQPSTVHRDTSLPRACDAASDDSDKFQDSLNKMSYTSPVESDKGDSSPPVPLTPEDLQKKEKEVKNKSVVTNLWFEGNLGTCPLRVSELGVTVVPTTHIPLPSPYKPRTAESENESDSEGSVVSGTIPHVSSASKETDIQPEIEQNLRNEMAVSVQPEQQSPRVLTEKTNCLDQFAAAQQQSLNLKGMVSKPSAYRESTLSVRDLSPAAWRPGFPLKSPEVHGSTEVNRSEATKQFTTDSNKHENAQLPRSVFEQQSLASRTPLHVHVPENNWVQSSGYSPASVRFLDRTKDFQNLSSSVSPRGEMQREPWKCRADVMSRNELPVRNQPMSRAELMSRGSQMERTESVNKNDPLCRSLSGSRAEGMSRTERIISEMLGIDSKHAKDKSSATSIPLSRSYSDAGHSSPRGYRADVVPPSPVRGTGHRVWEGHQNLSGHPGHSVKPLASHRGQDVQTNYGDLGSKSPGSAVSPGRYGTNGVDSHLVKHLSHSPASAAKSPRSQYDLAHQQDMASSRYGVSPRSIHSDYSAHGLPSQSPSKYSVSPRSVDEHFTASPGRHSSVSPGRHSSMSPGRYSGASHGVGGRYSSTSPGRHDFLSTTKQPLSPSRILPGSPRYTYTSPGRHTSASPGRYSTNPRGKEDHMARFSGSSPGRYCGSSPRGTEDRHFSRQSSHSPGRYSQNLYNNDHVLRTASSAGVDLTKHSTSSFGKSGGSPSKHSPRHGKQRSIGDYLDEMIESAFAELTSDGDKSGQSRQADAASAGACSKGFDTYSAQRLLATSQGLSMVQSQYPVSGERFNPSCPVPKSIPGSQRVDVTPCVTYADSAIDLSAPKATTAEALTAFGALPLKTLESSATSTVVSHPTWTTVKTDNFENITDDEDDDVIPSSQEYSASVCRFPGFRRISSSTTPSWSPYMGSHQNSSVQHSARHHDINSEHSHRLYTSQSYGSGLLKVADTSRGRGDLSSHDTSHSYHSQGQRMYTSYGTSPAKTTSVSSYMPSHNSQISQSFVTSFGTQWQDSQTKDSTASSGTSLPNFEPITDSEDEEPNRSPRKHSLPEHRDMASSWLRHASRMSYPLTVITERDMTGTTTSSLHSHGTDMEKTSASLQPPLLQQVDPANRWGHRGSSIGNVSAPCSGDSPDISMPQLTREVTSCDQPVPSKADNAVTTNSDHQSNQPGTNETSSPDHPSFRRTAVNSDSFRVTADSSGSEQLIVHCCAEDNHKPEDGGGSQKNSSNHEHSPNNPPVSSNSFSDGPHSGNLRLPSEPPAGDDQTPSRRSHRDEFYGSTHQLVLCPKAPPPSQELVSLTAVSYGLSTESVTKAYCSNPADLPDKPRELGGRVLRIGSNRITELDEMEPPGGVTGLREWQSILAADSDVLPSQVPVSVGPTPGSLRDRLDQEPQLRGLLAGDRSFVITPVLPPPSHAAVSAWIEKKLQGLVRDGHIKEEKLRGGDIRRSSEIPLSPDTEASILGDESTLVNSSDEDEDFTLFTKLKQKDKETSKTSTLPAPSSSNPVPVGDDDHARSSTPPKRQRLDSDSVVHSTPVRRSSTELFEAGCTPIAAPRESLPGSEAAGAQSTEEKKEEFVTPKRLPLRRLSTNTESALRRAIHTSQARQSDMDTSQIDGPTPKNTHGFKVTQQKMQDAKALHKHQFLTVLSMELHVETRGDLMPDPEVDNICAIFYSVFDDIPPERGRRSITGVIIVNADSCDGGASGRGGDRSSPGPSSSKVSAVGKHRLLERCGVQEDLDVKYVATEGDLLQQVIELVSRLDPDILLGFEVQQLSWGFLLQRASHLSVNLCAQIARIQGSKLGNRFSAERDEWGADHTSEIHIEGRIVLNLWRVLRHEVTLNIYTYENCAYHILHCRVPSYSFRTLTFWYNHHTHLYRWRVIHHYTERVKGELAMLDQLDIIGKTSEFSRVFGIEFYDVLSRGSQYRVESMMLRLAKPLNFIPVSPSVQQRARQKAPECIPLNLEPESRFYVDPVVVLDFQSLYPSIMIAYNYCFSTCLGRLEHLAHAHEGPIEFGCTSLNVPPETLRKLRKNVTISPNGCVFITQKVRRGVLPMMVEEILKTRLMVKKSMKEYKDDKTLHRMLDARQLGLKLIANVTYGYTGASFSGRMPCIEVGDSIVRKARESLERAIRLVEDTPHWQARVVYGDTDSLFIHLPGRTKDQAFDLGQEIADTISDMFPKPMKLKFEKVYLPCVLQTKKRYVGFMYETKDQQQPVFDAKGIETVRRDNCGVVSKVLECCIKTLFTTRDVSRVRSYLQRQFTKMLSGRVGLQDFIFAKEYRGMMGYKPGACVPALEIAKRRLKDDRRAEPRVGERVPYVIVHGSPGLPLIQLVRQPGEVLRDTALRINVVYYITKQVLPPLDRLLGLVGVSVFQWYNDMPKVIRMAPSVLPAQDTKQGTISQYFVTSDCLVCERQTKQPVCTVCLKDPQRVAVTLASRCSFWETVHDHLSQVCFSCMGTQDGSQPCTSLDCPVLFRRHLAGIDLTRANQQREALEKAVAAF